jgi:biopolymer transport protein ExbD
MPAGSSRGRLERTGVSGRTRPAASGVGAAIAVNFAPMIDVTFLLLIFFLVTTTFERAEGILASDLPRDSGAPAVALPVSPIVIRLAPDESDLDGVTIHIDYFDYAPGDMDSLPATLGRIHQEPGFDKQTPVVIVAENDVRWDHVVNCWNAALRAGCERIAFAEP